MQTSRTWGAARTRLLAATVLTAALVGSGCSGLTPPTPADPPPATAPSASSPAAPTSTASASATPSVPTPTATTSTPTSKRSAPPDTSAGLTRTVDAGRVTEAKSRRVSGSGAAELHVTKGGDFAVVVKLDCSRCTGSVLLTAQGRKTPLGRAAAPLKSAYLVGVSTDEPIDQTVTLRATGRWKVTFLSWNRLPVDRGRQSGRGSTVLRLSDRADALRVSYRPAGEGDQFHARVFNVVGEPELFGDTEAFTDTIRAKLPGVVAISTNGSWTVTPLH